MRIVYDYQTFSLREYIGISRYFVELAAHMSRLPGVEVRIVAPLLRSLFLAERRSSIAVTGIDVSGIEWMPLKAVQRTNSLLFRAIAASCHPDIVHETSYAPERSAPRSAKIVTTIHDTIPERLPEMFSAAAEHKERIRKAVQRADRVICVSESTKRDLLDLYDVQPERVAVVRLASCIAPSAQGPIDIGSPYFLHVGGRYAYKNFGGLLRAFADSQLYRTHKLVAFSSHGLGRDELEQIHALGIPSGSVIATGGGDNLLARYYAGAEALVFPSIYEGFGIPLVEAMSCGCPIVAGNTSSLPEVGGDAALYCDPADPGSIAAAMLQITGSSETRARLIAKGLERARLFSWEKCAAETYAVYQQIAPC
jgi:glycosyltransferase involved in cell wall biosynthesis